MVLRSSMGPDITRAWKSIATQNKSMLWDFGPNCFEFRLLNQVLLLLFVA